MLKAAFALLLCVVFFSCKKDYTPQTGPYDLDVVLHGADKYFGASGFVKFRQDPDTARIITLDTWVSNLEPNHSYLLQRAVNPSTDPTGCSSTAWLTLGSGLQPLSIDTDNHGNGKANLWRDVTSATRGASFHIHFQVIDATTLATVLTSDCFDYTVR